MPLLARPEPGSLFAQAKITMEWRAIGAAVLPVLPSPTPLSSYGPQKGTAHIIGTGATTSVGGSLAKGAGAGAAVGAEDGSMSNEPAANICLLRLLSSNYFNQSVNAKTPCLRASSSFRQSYARVAARRFFLNNRQLRSVVKEVISSRQSWFFLSQELSRLPFNSETIKTLSGPATVFEKYGLIVNHHTTVRYHDQALINVDFNATWANMQVVANQVLTLAQTNQVDTARLFGDFFVAFFNRSLLLSPKCRSKMLELVR
ncbi:hypothetical protein F5Y10DRAFT_272604 [Nemania abortiva]|nr:hypothetical protein F5Y10DRAFT_272604 [Nemania abortiva]